MKSIQFLDMYKHETEEIIANAFPGDPKTHMFNPSFFLSDQCAAFSVRIRTVTKENRVKHCVSINGELFEAEEKWDVPRAYDIKFFMMEEELWVTFNTARHANNSIYVAKVYPEIGPAIEVKYDERKEIEKNWAFFMKDEKIYCLYSLDPYTILVNKGNWEFEKVIEKENFCGLTIGTQINDGYFVAHEKINTIKGQLYTGVLCKFDKNNFNISISEDNYCHNAMVVAGRKASVRMDWGCYFSGLQKTKDGIIVGYGITDNNTTGQGNFGVVLISEDMFGGKILCP